MSSYKPARAAPGQASAKRRLPRPYLLDLAAASSTRSAESWLCLLVPESERVAAVAQAWTSRLSVEPGVLLLEIGGSRRLFGGLDALRDEVARVFAAHGWTLRCALAPTPRAALWLARGAPGTWIESTAQLAGALSRLPLAVLDLPPRTLDRLRGFGLRTLGDVSRLPRAPLARRIGPALDDALARALGEAPDPQAAWHPPPRFSAAHAFEFELRTAEPLCRALAPLFAELVATLQRANRGVRRCTVKLIHRAGPPTRVRVAVLDPVRDTARLEAQFALHLERQPLRAPVVAVALHAARLERVEEISRDLFAKAGGESWNALLERLRARLGEAALRHVVPHADHRPERAYHLVDPCRSGACGSGAMRRDGCGSGAMRCGSGAVHCGSGAMRRDAMRPTWLLTSPRQIDATRYRLESGPERIESGWWDDADIARDYFVARDGAGARAWVYRERHTPYRWFVHGLFG